MLDNDQNGINDRLQTIAFGIKVILPSLLIIVAIIMFILGAYNKDPKISSDLKELGSQLFAGGSIAAGIANKK